MDNIVSIIVHDNTRQRNNKNKIIITSTQYPRYGGAATAAYEFHKYLINSNIESVCIFFDNTSANDPKKNNPDDYPNVFGQKLISNYENIDTRKYLKIISILKKMYGDEPYNIYGFNYMAPILSKKIFKKSKIYYLITGCSYITNNNLVDSTKFLNTEKIDQTDAIERYTIQISDVIVPNSELTKNIVEHVYKIYVDKYIDLHEIFKINNFIHDKEKLYDIAFICSNFRRNVKNVELVKKLFFHNDLINHQKICIGTNSSMIKDLNIPNLYCIDFIHQNEIINILNKTKIVIIPSYIESYSITAVEATQCGSIVLCSKNAACSATINKYFVIDNYEPSEWLNKINTILQNYNYYKKIFWNDYTKTTTIDKLWEEKNDKPSGKITILFTSVDIPYIGGAATNLYNLIKSFVKDPMFNVYGIFFTNLPNDHNPEKIPNIYKISLDKYVIKNLEILKSSINVKNNIDLIFCKNYKVIPFAKNVFRNVPIIFSPSGLRYVSTHPTDNFINNFDFKNIIKPPIEKKIDNIYKYVIEHDAKLDFYALANSDIIVPNSLLTYDIIKKLYGNLQNLCYPIPITNISLTTINNDAFDKRPYDILFCCISWKRKCKNYELVKVLVNDPRMANKKIIIIGNHQTASYGPNVTKYTYIENNKLMELLNTIKIVVIPSKYDSNPNVLVEAIKAGCNVVTSTNVGNNENLKKDCIVSNYNDVNCWIETIEKCLKKRYDFVGPTADRIMEQIKNLFITRVIKKKKSVAIYKIPPEIEENIYGTIECTNNNFDYSEEYDDEFVKNIVNYDIYFILFVELSIKEECNDINYIIYDDQIPKNYYYYVYKVYPTYGNNIRIWKIKDLASLMYFNNANFYFMRGNYHNFYKIIIPAKAKSILYPATAALQGNDNRISPKDPYKFNIVLVHEDPIYKTIFKNSICIKFNKFAPDKYICQNIEREYDICFIATEKQITKNHHLFLDFLKYLENHKIVCNVIFIGNLSTILIKYNMEKYMEKLSYVKLYNHTKCTKEELITIYNKSRINIIFSGRDSEPRVIYESSACGCFNIALDTLSDGKDFYDGYLGILIGDPTVPKILQKSASLSYLPNNLLWEKLEKYLKIKYDHMNISIYSKKMYNLYRTVNNIYI